jgi:RNA polymerase sigma factor (sigma-70 family)
MRAEFGRSSPGECGGSQRAGVDDAVLLAGSVSDPEQFAVLFRRHVSAIQRYVTRRIGQVAADDVVSETFLIAFRQRARYQSDGRDCLPWLYGIATRLIGRHWRTEVQQLRLLARTGVDPVAEPFTERVDEAVAACQSRSRVAEALASLPKEQRDALLLVAWAGLSYDQVAKATGVPVGTVQSRINRARSRLRAKLADLEAPVQEVRIAPATPLLGGNRSLIRPARRNEETCCD